MGRGSWPGAGGAARAIQANVSRPAEVERLFAEATKAFGKIDILVNNAGVFDIAPLGTITVEHFQRLFEINVLGTILATQEALKHFNPAGGSIINTSSNVSTMSPAGTAVYNATKSAIDGLTRTFAKELGARQIRVNSINPGPTESDGVHAQGLFDMFTKLGAQTALGRIGQPDDIAPAVVYLASDDASWVTGETHYITGGTK
ncbi:MAG TPA: SDR family oxidoreductase [Verrucomicrobiota bacterium]|nr:SDR family oxidoreductase [Verrucomicrobiota bacterium]